MTLAIFGVIVLVYLVCYSSYSLKKDNPARRSRLLRPMLVTSLFGWAFIGSSLLLCLALLGQYEAYPELTIQQVLCGSLLASLAFAVTMSFPARHGGFSKLRERLTTESIMLSRVEPRFHALRSQMGLCEVSLRTALLGSAFSISLNGKGVVAISPELARSLSPDETEAVIAHELSHIKNGDSSAKGLARLARIAFPFDPVLRLVEAAVHRERELWADRVAVQYTRKPLALASALIKANSKTTTGMPSHAVDLFAGGGRRALLCRYPDLGHRIDVLLSLARQMEFSAILAMPA